jgi:hypothetical protein
MTCIISKANVCNARAMENALIKEHSSPVTAETLNSNPNSFFTTLLSTSIFNTLQADKTLSHSIDTDLTQTTATSSLVKIVCQKNEDNIYFR